MLKSTVWNSDSQHSSAEFSVRHMMVSTVKGRFSDIQISYVGDPEDFTKGSAYVEIDTSSVQTFDKKRDEHLRSDDFFNSGRFPKIVFRSNGIERNGGNHFKVTGDITIRNITKEITVDVEYTGKIKDPWGNERIGLSATGEIIREDFGLRWNTMLEAGGVLVGSRVRMQVDGQLILQKEDQ